MTENMGGMRGRGFCLKH